MNLISSFFFITIKLFHFKFIPVNLEEDYFLPCKDFNFENNH